MSRITQSGAPNLPGWSLDANSPWFETGVSDPSFTLDTPSDEALLRPYGDYSGFFEMRVNGVSSNEYTIVNNADSSTVDTDRIDNVTVQEVEYIHIRVGFGDQIFVSIKPSGNNSAQTTHGLQKATNTAVESIQLLGSNFDVALEVYTKGFES